MYQDGLIERIKIFYSLNQSVLLHLLSKFLAFLAFIAFKGLKRPKKAEKKTFAKWLRIVQFGEKSNKKNFPSQNFFDLCDLGESRSLTVVAFYWEKSDFLGSRRLVLKKVLVAILCFFVRCSLIHISVLGQKGSHIMVWSPCLMVRTRRISTQGRDEEVY